MPNPSFKQNYLQTVNTDSVDNSGQTFEKIMPSKDDKLYQWSFKRIALLSLKDTVKIGVNPIVIEGDMPAQIGR